MVSQLVFNPQSLMPNQQFDPQIARQAMDALIDLIKATRDNQLEIAMIRANRRFNDELFMDGCSIERWCREMSRPQAQRAVVEGFLLKKNIKVTVPAWVGLTSSEERLGKDYCFDDHTWALAYFFDFVLFSFHTASQWNTEIFETEYFDLTLQNDETQPAFIRHASYGVHIVRHKRIYYCHPKHCHHLPFTGRRDTEMDLIFEDAANGNKEAEVVLRNAVRVPTKKQLIGYSKRTQKLYEFQPETPLSPNDRPWLGNQNRYHGYPITPKELHDDVGGNIYDEIIDSLAERAIIDTDTAKDLKKPRSSN